MNLIELQRALTQLRLGGIAAFARNCAYAKHKPNRCRPSI